MGSVTRPNSTEKRTALRDKLISRGYYPLGVDANAERQLGVEVKLRVGPSLIVADGDDTIWAPVWVKLLLERLQWGEAWHSSNRTEAAQADAKRAEIFRQIDIYKSDSKKRKVFIASASLARGGKLMDKYMIDAIQAALKEP